MKKIMTGILMLAYLLGCQAGGNEETQEMNEPMQMANNNKLNQAVSEQADRSLRNKNNLTDVQVVNDDKQLLIAAQIPHNERLHMKRIEKDLTKQAEEKFPKYQVTLSLDKKIHLEVMKLKKKMAEGTIDRKKLSKELDRLIKLSKEKT
ncbi:YhcN/YlaJ family sporulation lipoprotein [Thalassobacillus sp. B23F22_16]|uniref:YhcN/YlaJ family sporulation lipoprotein n=1 Tax=Thalassobacillus sp. B23F22_16 TaxID=3459513 RepID=UPI00373E247A